MPKKSSVPTRSFEPQIILRDIRGYQWWFKTRDELNRFLWGCGISQQLLYGNALPHGHFRRSVEDVENGRSQFASFSVRLCTGEPALGDVGDAWLYLIDRRLARGKTRKSWFSRRKQKRSERNRSRVTRIWRNEGVRKAEEEPQVRRRRAKVGPRSEVQSRSKSWKDQTRCRKQWQKRQA